MWQFQRLLTSDSVHASHSHHQSNFSSATICIGVSTYLTGCVPSYGLSALSPFWWTKALLSKFQLLQLFPRTKRCCSWSIEGKGLNMIHHAIKPFLSPAKHYLVCYYQDKTNVAITNALRAASGVLYSIPAHAKYCMRVLNMVVSHASLRKRGALGATEAVIKQPLAGPRKVLTVAPRWQAAAGYI